MSMTLTQDQQRVSEWLKDDLDLPVFSESYISALLLLKRKPPSYITLVAHIGRDIMNILGPAVAGVSGPRVQYVDHTNKIAGAWLDEWGSQGFTGDEEKDVLHCIPEDTCQLVKDLVDEHKAGRANSNRASVLFYQYCLEYTDPESIPLTYILEWRDTSRFFQSFAHIRIPPFPSEAPAEIERHFGVLDNLLQVAAGRTYDRLSGIRDILDEANR